MKLNARIKKFPKWIPILIAALIISGYSLYWIARQLHAPPVVAICFTVAFDWLALYEADESLQAVKDGDSDRWPRFIACAFALGSAWINSQHAVMAHEPPAARLIWAGSSLTALIAYDSALRKARNKEKKERGLKHPDLKPSIDLRVQLRHPWWVNREKTGASVLRAIALFRADKVKVMETLPDEPVTLILTEYPKRFFRRRGIPAGSADQAIEAPVMAPHQPVIAERQPVIPPVMADDDETVTSPVINDEPHRHPDDATVASVIDDDPSSPLSSDEGALDEPDVIIGRPVPTPVIRDPVIRRSPARRGKGGHTNVASIMGDASSLEVRTWAKKQPGLKVGDHARIAREVYEAFYAAHPERRRKRTG